MDADRCREFQSAPRRPDQVLRAGEQQGGHDHAIEQALDQAQEGQLEEEEPDVAAEDRVRDRAGHVRREAR